MELAELKFTLRDISFIELPLGKFKKKPKPRKCRRKYPTKEQILFEIKVAKIKMEAEKLYR